MHSADMPSAPSGVVRVPRAAVVGCAVAVVLAGLAYLNALPNPFIYDDHHTVVANPSLRSGNLLAILLHDRTRPIVNLTYAWDQLIWQGRPFGFRLTNLALHLANVGLLYRLAWHLGVDRRDAHRDLDLPFLSPATSAFAVASLFAVHPVLSESVAYISARHEVLCATVFLAGLLCARRWLRHGGAGWGAGAIALWMLAMATKEVGAMFPAVLLAYDVFWCPAAGRHRRLVRIHLPLLVAAALLGVGRLLFLTMVEFPGEARMHWGFVWLVLDVVRRYVTLLVAPLGQAAFHAVAPVTSVVDSRALVAIATIALMLTLAWRVRAFHWFGSLGLVWFLLLLVPGAVLTLFNRGEPMTEHRVYLASCGFFLAAGDGLAWIDNALQRVGRVVVLGRAAFAVVLLSALSLTVTRNQLWGKPIALWGEAVDLAPGHPRPRLLLGEALEDAGRLDEAAAEYRRAVAMLPSDADGHVKLGRLSLRQGRVQEAREHFEAVLAADPDNRAAQQSIALIERLTPAPVDASGR